MRQVHKALVEEARRQHHHLLRCHLNPSSPCRRSSLMLVTMDKECNASPSKLTTPSQPSRSLDLPPSILLPLPPFRLISCRLSRPFSPHPLLPHCSTLTPVTTQSSALSAADWTGPFRPNGMACAIHIVPSWSNGHCLHDCLSCRFERLM